MPGANIVAKIYEGYRVATSSLRLEPSFLIIGVQRAGTSSFYWNMVRHPQIIAASTKEIHFFDLERNYQKGLPWYMAHFPLNFDYRALLNSGVITGEATPAYMYRPYVACRVAKMFPDIKLIILLRNPVDRAYSNFQMSFRQGTDSGTFAQAIMREIGHLGGRRIDRTNLEDYALMPYLQRGVYVEQLKSWLEYFDRQQLLILDGKDFYSDPLKTLHRTTHDFLGLSDWSAEKYHKHYKEGVKYPLLDTKLHTLLTDFYRPYNQELYQLLGWDLGWE
jgi:hypothetical protein